MLKTTYLSVPSNGLQCVEPKFPSERQEMFLKKAAQCAFRSNMSQRHGCVIVNQAGDIVSSGFNYKKTYHCHRYSMHAEANALNKLKRATDMSQFEMYVVRIGNRSGEHTDPELKCSMPCASCMKAIVKASLPRVYFSM